jgi:hypothetical protein
MRWFQNINNINDLRTQYKKLLVLYHPDNHPNEDTTSIIQEINVEYETLFKRLKEGFEQSPSYEKASEKTRQFYDWEKDSQIRNIIKELSRFHGIQIEICGIWIYVSGNTFPYKNEFKALGLKWNKKKMCWFIHFDEYYKRSNKVLSMDRIRDLYGSSVIPNKEENLLKG